MVRTLIFNACCISIHISDAVGCFFIRGSAWRDNREFVGQINYGAVYKLWNPSENLSFGGNFRSAARCLLMCQRRVESPFARLPDECIYYILNMCRWDSFNDTSIEMRRVQRQTRRLERQRIEREADRMLEEEAGVGRDAANVDDAAEEEIDENSDFMDESSEDDDEDDESDDDSFVSNAWGDHVNTRDSHTFQLPESDDSDTDDEMTHDEWRHQSRFQHRGSMVHRSFFSARSRIFNVLNGVPPQDRGV